MYAPGRSRQLRTALLRHVLALALVVAVVSLLIVWQSGRAATDDARAATEGRVRTIGLELSAPLRSQTLSADDTWQRDLDTALLPRVRAGELLQVKVWAPRADRQGEVIWSTKRDEVGAVRTMDSEFDLFGTDGTAVHEVLADSYPDRDLPPNLFEAYIGFADRSGAPYILEVYKPVRDSGRIRSALLRDWLPLSLGGVFLLGLATLPLSIGLARRVVAVERERRAIAQQALNAAAEEHQRMAEQIHDRALQDLAGATLLLGALQTQSLPESARRLADQVDSIVAEDIVMLRGLLDGPEAARRLDQPLAADAAERAAALGLERVELDIDQGLVLGDSAVEMASRILKEALRNVAKHAPEATVRVEATQRRGPEEELVMTIADDGPGFDPTQVPDGHYGLRLMGFVAQSMGGTLAVESAPGLGTTLRVTLPRRPPAAHRRTRLWRTDRP